MQEKIHKIDLTEDYLENKKNEEFIQIDSKEDIKGEKILNNSIKNDENIPLISEEEKKEKNDLLEIFKRLEVDLASKEFETLNQIYSQYINNEDINKRNIKPNTSKFCLLFMFYVISPIFGIINLIGIFESITILKIIFQILLNSSIIYLKSLRKNTEKNDYFSIEDFNNNYNFYNMFFEDTKKESFDFNLIMFTSFLGDILLKSRGFRISISVFGGINGIGMLLILGFSFFNYNSKDNTYSIFQILYLLLCWLILFVGVGASALLSQQIILDSNIKYTKYQKKVNEESKIIREQKMKETKKRRKN